MASNYNQQDRLGSRLSGSSWRPSSGPYDTPMDGGNHGAGSGGGGIMGGNGLGGGGISGRPSQPRSANSSDPTPNSLNCDTTGRVQFSRAEYKAPNSFQNSLEGAHYAVNHNNWSTTAHNVGAVMNATPPSAGATPGGVGGGGGSPYRESKSYMDRYQDVKHGRSDGRTSTSGAGKTPGRSADAGSRSRSAGRSRVETPERAMASRGVLRRGYDEDPGRSRSAGRTRETPERVSHELRRGYEDDSSAVTGMSERTPLERWESRKERKMMERGLEYKRRSDDNEYASPGREAPRAVTPSQRAVTPTRGASRSVAKDRASRWSPQEEEDNGYEEYDDFIGTTRRPRSSSRRDNDRHSSRHDDRRETPHGHPSERTRDRDGSSSDGYHDDRRGSVGRSRSREQRSSRGSESRPSGRSGSQYDEQRYRPDPLGHRNSSLSEYGTNDGSKGDGSPLFTDVDLEGAGNIEVGDSSPLAIENHFERSSPQRGSPPRGSPPRGSPQRSNAAATRTKSTYADDLKSFTESVTAPVAAQQQHQQSILRNPTYNAQQPQPPSVVRSHNGAQYSQMEAGTNGKNTAPDTGVPISQYQDGARVASHQEQQRATDICKRFTGRDCAPIKKKSKYMCITLVVFAACAIAAGLAIYYIGEKQDQEDKMEREGFDFSVTVEETDSPTVSIIPTATPTATPTEDPTATPTTRPTNERERLISDYLESLSNKASNKVGTPQYNAKMWLLHEDTLNLHLPNSNIDRPLDSWESDVAIRMKQRYALATLYYSMGIGTGGVVKGWLEGEECMSVLGAYGRAWDGVGCDDDGFVRALALDGANLHGNIPYEISHLTSLENLIIKNNPGLIGQIHHTIGTHLSQLRQLGLNSNNLTGTIPKNIFRLSNLVYLNLGDNALEGTVHWEESSHYQNKLHRLILHNNHLGGSIDFHLLAKSSDSLSLLSLSNNEFDGMIDDTVGSMTSLEYLYLDGNKLVGSIPNGVCNLMNLKSLNLDENGLYGTLPINIGEMESLEYLSARGNTISGKLPESMKSMTMLSTLNLASNALSGPLDHLVHMTGLRNVHLYQNTFSGMIDGQLFTALPNLEVLFLSSNLLTGGIPSEVGGAQNQLKGLYLSDNKLEGSIPGEVCALYKVEDLFLDDNSLSGTLPECLGSLSNLQRFYIFKNQFEGYVPAGLIKLPHLIGLGIEENDIRGGFDSKTCTPLEKKSMSIWADCTELDGGCECCDRCCSDQGSNC